MTDELLLKIKGESSDGISKLADYNARARLLNEIAKQEEFKRSIGLPFKPGLEMPEYTENDVIMKAYEKYIPDIKDEDTNDIYVYVGTFKYLQPTFEQIEAGYPLQEEVDRDDQTADFRCYAKIEGRFSYNINIDEADEFERTHTVLFADNVYEVEKEFITTAVKTDQEKAASLVLSKYNN